VLLTDSPTNLKPNREKLLTYMFDTFKVQNFYVASQAPSPHSIPRSALLSCPKNPLLTVIVKRSVHCPFSSLTTQAPHVDAPALSSD
jgi:hypothetical protein